MRSAPGANVARNDPDLMRLGASCFDAGGAHYCPADTMDNGSTDCGDDGSFIIVMLKRGTQGLHWQVTPAGARVMAAALLRSADAAERRQTAAAAAQLDAVLKKGKS